MNALKSVSESRNLPTLLHVHLGLSLLGALSTCPVYNIPIFLYAISAYHTQGSTSPLVRFTCALALSIVLDILWFILHRSELGTSNNEAAIPHARGFAVCMAMNIVNLIGKPFTVLSSLNLLEDRGEFIGCGRSAYPGEYQTVRDGDNEF
ncbi:hypothetical protein BX666DRAFT_1438706 [Dichotomocladium elegans]|nr:hypothetical protein BX666DRAFT_1438706 [Dichotomocladium elegans]